MLEQAREDISGVPTDPQEKCVCSETWLDKEHDLCLLQVFRPAEKSSLAGRCSGLIGLLIPRVYSGATTTFIGWPDRNAKTLSIASPRPASVVSGVMPAECGVSTTFGSE